MTKHLKELFGDDYCFTVDQHVVIVRRQDRSDAIECRIDVDPQMEPREAAEFVYHVYKNKVMPTLAQKDIKDAAYILSNVLPEVRPQNKRLADEFVVEQYLDFAVYYKVFVSDEISFRVSFGMLQCVGLTIDDIRDAAYANALHALRELLFSTLFGGVMRVWRYGDNCGAGIIAVPACLDKIAEVYCGDYYVIPVSMHEIMTLAVSDFKDIDDVKKLREIVMEINDSDVVADDDILSYNIYRYDFRSQSLEVANAD